MIEIRYHNAFVGAIGINSVGRISLVEPCGTSYYFGGIVGYIAVCGRTKLNVEGAVVHDRCQIETVIESHVADRAQRAWQIDAA